MVKRKYVMIAILLALFGALTLAFGQCVGFSDVVRGGITGFVFALIPVVIHIGYDLAKKEKEREQERKSVLLGIYLELYEALEYLADLFKSGGTIELDFIPPLPTTAWETACLRGFVDPQTDFGYKLRHIYETVNNFNYLMSRAVDTAIGSTLPRNENLALTKGLITLLRSIHTSLVPLLKEVKTELEHVLDISTDEVNKRREETKTKILETRFNVSSKDKDT